MSANNPENTYVWVMAWSDNAAASPRPTFDVYSIEPAAGVRAEDFEKFMIDEMFPVVDFSAETPTGEHSHDVKHYLFKQIGAFDPDRSGVPADYVRDPSVLAKFRSLSTPRATHYFDLVGSVELKASRDRE